MFKKHLRKFANRQTNKSRNIGIRRRVVKNHSGMTKFT